MAGASAAAAVGVLQGAAAVQGAVALGRQVLEVGGVLGNLSSLREFVTGARQLLRQQAPENDAALAQLQRSIEVLSTSLEGAEVDLPPEELEAVSAQETAVRGFLQECTANPQMHDIAAKCERLENRLSHVFVRLTFLIQNAIGKRLREQPDTQGRCVRRLLGHGEGGVQVFTRGEGAAGDSDDSRASTPPQEHQDVWLALYSVEHENERGQLLRQLRSELEGSRLLTHASLILFDFMECAQVQESDDLLYWRDEIRRSVRTGGAEAAGGAAAGGAGGQVGRTPVEREDMLAQMVNDFVGDGAVQHRILDPVHFPLPAALDELPEEDRRGCASVVYNLVKSQLRSQAKRGWERAFAQLPAGVNRRVFFEKANETLENEAVMRQCGWVRHGSSSVVYIRASRIWAYLATLAVAYDPGTSGRLYRLGFRIMVSDFAPPWLTSTPALAPAFPAPMNSRRAIIDSLGRIVVEDGAGRMRASDASEAPQHLSAQHGPAMGGGEGESSGGARGQHSKQAEVQAAVRAPASTPQQRQRPRSHACAQIIGEIMAAAAEAEVAAADAARGAGLAAAAEASSASALSNSAMQVLGKTGVEVYPGTGAGLSPSEGCGDLDLALVESGIEVYPGTGGNLVESEGVRRPHVSTLLVKMQLAKLFRAYEDRLGKGIGLARARELVRDALLAKRQTFSQDLVEQYASEMLTAARHDPRVAGHVSLQGFLRYVEQQRELLAALLLRQPSLAPVMPCQESFVDIQAPHSSRVKYGRLGKGGHQLDPSSFETGCVSPSGQVVAVETYHGRWGPERRAVVFSRAGDRQFQVPLRLQEDEDEEDKDASLQFALAPAGSSLVVWDYLERSANLFVFEGLLPEGWQECADLITGKRFYLHVATNAATWQRPGPAPVLPGVADGLYVELGPAKSRVEPRKIKSEFSALWGHEGRFLVGGYRAGDSVRSRIAQKAQNIRIGDVGRVLGPADKPGRVIVDFGIDKGKLSMSAHSQVVGDANERLWNLSGAELEEALAKGSVVHASKVNQTCDEFSTHRRCRFFPRCRFLHDEVDGAGADAAGPAAARGLEDSLPLRSRRRLVCEGSILAVAYHPSSAILITCSEYQGDVTADAFANLEHSTILDGTPTKLECWSVGDGAGDTSAGAGDATAALSQWLSAPGCDCMAWNDSGTSLLKAGDGLLEVWHVPLGAGNSTAAGGTAGGGSAPPSLLLRSDFLMGQMYAPFSAFSSCGDFLIRHVEVGRESACEGVSQASRGWEASVHFQVWDCRHISTTTESSEKPGKRGEREAGADDAKISASARSDTKLAPPSGSQCPRFIEMAAGAQHGPDAAEGGETRCNRLVFTVCSSHGEGFSGIGANVQFIPGAARMAMSSSRLACVAPGYITWTATEERAEQEVFLLHVTVWSASAPAVEAMSVIPKGMERYGDDGQEWPDLRHVSFSACGNQLLVVMDQRVVRFDLDSLLKGAALESVMCSAQQLIWQARELASLETYDACLAHCVCGAPSWRVQCDQHEWRREENRLRFASLPSVVSWNLHKGQQDVQGLVGEKECGVDPAALDTLREIGFDKSVIKKALMAKKNNIQRATEAIFNGEIQPDGTGASVVADSAEAEVPGEEAELEAHRFKHAPRCCRALDKACYGSSSSSRRESSGHLCSRWLAWRAADSLMTSVRCALGEANAAAGAAAARLDGREAVVEDGGVQEVQGAMKSLRMLSLLLSSARNFEAFVSVEDLHKDLGLTRTPSVCSHDMLARSAQLR